MCIPSKEDDEEDPRKQVEPTILGEIEGRKHSRGIQDGPRESPSSWEREVPSGGDAN